MLRPTRSGHQGGVTLVESLVAMLVLSLGVGALAWSQARQLADGRDTSARAAAVLLTEDLANRMLFNRATAASAAYTLAWGERPTPAQCRSTACSGAMLARADLSDWRDALAQTLPGGDARVFAEGLAGRRIGILIAWHSAASSDPSRRVPLSEDASDPNLLCPNESLCHVTYVPI